jgi:hypothetical protein
MQRSILFTAGFLIILLNSQPLFASTLSDIKIIKISSQDQSAVIRSDHKLRLIKPGDTLSENSRVLEISAGRIVIEENTAKAKETVIIYFENGKQSMERIGRSTSQNPALYMPQTVVKQE